MILTPGTAAGAGTCASSTKGLKLLFVVAISASSMDAPGIRTPVSAGTAPAEAGVDPADNAGMLPLFTTALISIPEAALTGAGVAAASAPLSVMLCRMMEESPPAEGSTDTPPSNTVLVLGMEGVRMLWGTGTGVGVALLWLLWLLWLPCELLRWLLWELWERWEEWDLCFANALSAKNRLSSITIVPIVMILLRGIVPSSS